MKVLSRQSSEGLMTRLFRSAVLGALAIVVGMTHATANTFNVVNNPPAPGDSTVELTFYGLQPPEYFPGAGPVQASGSANISVSVTADAASPWTAGTGNGSFNFNSSSFSLADATGLLDIGLGTFDLTYTNIGFTITSTGNIPVVGNQWNLDAIGSPDTFEIAFNSGTLVLDNPTGFLAYVVTEPIVIDFSVAPSVYTLSDLLGFGIGGTADSQSISMDLAGFERDKIVYGPLELGGAFTGQLFLTVPEPSSIVLASLGIVLLVGRSWRRGRH